MSRILYCLLLGLLITQVSAQSLVEELKKCSLSKSGGRGFLDESPLQLDYTVKFYMDLHTRSMANEAFKYVGGDPTSATFWGRWDLSEEAFVYHKENNSFTMFDADFTRVVSDFHYDADNNCHRFDSNVTGGTPENQLPKGVHATANLASIVVKENRKFIVYNGSFNCKVSNGDEALRKKFCLTVATSWPNTKIHFIECLLNNYKDDEDSIHKKCNKIIMPGVAKS